MKLDKDVSSAVADTEKPENLGAYAQTGKLI